VRFQPRTWQVFCGINVTFTNRWVTNVEFFTANIRNPHTRRAYARACARFFAWCDDRELIPATIRPHDVATYIGFLEAESYGYAIRLPTNRNGIRKAGRSTSTAQSRSRACGGGGKPTKIGGGGSEDSIRAN
jgi:hypothetical protein